MAAKKKSSAEKTYSRQYLYQMRRYEAGECTKCGKPRRKSPYKRWCEACGRKVTEAKRKKLGLKKWKSGGGGRPPLVSVRAKKAAAKRKKAAKKTSRKKRTKK